MLERVFPGVWKFLSSLRLPSWDESPSLPLLSLLLSFIFCPSSFQRQWAAFWVPDVLYQYSEVVLWNLLGVQMLFRWISGGESVLPVLILCPLRTTPPQGLLFLCMQKYNFGMSEEPQFGHFFW